MSGADLHHGSVEKDLQSVEKREEGTMPSQATPDHIKSRRIHPYNGACSQANPVVPIQGLKSVQNHVENSTPSRPMTEDLKPGKKHIQGTMSPQALLEDLNPGKKHIQGTMSPQALQEDLNPGKKHIQGTMSPQALLEDLKLRKEHVQGTMSPQALLEDLNPGKKHIQGTMPLQALQEDLKLRKEHIQGTMSPQVISENSKPDQKQVESTTQAPHTTDALIHKLSQTITKLRSMEDVSSLSAYSDIKYLWNMSRYTPDKDTSIIGTFGQENFVDVFQKVWTSSHRENIFNSKVEYPWRNLRNCLSIVWNCSNSSELVCEQVTCSGLLEEVLQSLQKMSSSRGYLDHDRKLYYVKSLFGILHNCVRNFPDCHPVLVESGGIDVLKPIAECPQPMIKAKSLIILSYLVDEEQSKVLSASLDTLEFIVDILLDSISAVNHFSAKYGMDAAEVLQGLNNLAHNDTNKVKLVQCGIVPVLRDLLLSEIKLEKRLAATGIWTLSFVKDNTAVLKADQKCVQALRNAARCQDKSVSHAARGALWEIFHDQQLSPESELEVNLPHVMISYQWDVQDTMIRVKDELRHAGYKVWMDVEHMSGSTLEAMALAVEKAAVVLICMSDKYKTSPSCRTEAEYIFRLRKDIIPLCLQPKFVPDGWLGMLVGSKLYFDLSHGNQLEKQLPRLVRELGHRGNVRSTCGSDLHNGMYMSSSGSSIRTDSLSQSVTCWTRKEVADWLAATGFDHVKERFADFDGCLLYELRRLQKIAPEYFYSNLKSELGLQFCDILRFSRSLSLL